MRTTEAGSFVRSIKGAPASVLFLLLLTGASFTAEELAANTGYSAPSIRAAIKYLEPRGYIQNNGRANGYSLPMAGKQLPLPLQQLAGNNALLLHTHTGPGSAGSVSEAADTHSNAPDTQNRKIFSRTEKFFPEPKKIFSSDPPLVDLVVDDDPDGERGRKQQQQHTPAATEKIFHVLRQIGIRGRAQNRLAEQITADELLALHFEASQLEGLNNPPGWIISQIDAGHGPDPELVAIAQFYLELDEADRDELRRQHVPQFTPGLLVDLGLNQSAAWRGEDLTRVKAWI